MTGVLEPSALPQPAADLARSIAAGEELGAMRNVVSIGSALAEVARAGADREVLDDVVAYFRATRGVESRAVANGLELLTADLPTDNPAERLEQRAQWFGNSAAAWNSAIVRAALETIDDGARVVAFDYSSVVAAVVAAGHRERGWRLVIAESRALDGGRPFVEELGADAVAEVIADVALGRAIRSADAVLIGAETCFADGSCHNTLGSFTAALCASKLGVPFYTATPLLKFAGADVASFEHSGARDFADQFGDLPGVDMLLPENERVPGELISSYITERGIIQPHELAAAAAAALGDIAHALATA